MSQTPQSYPQYASPGQQPAQTNGLGLAGFITSLIGALTCGFLSPIGLLLSLIGLTKRPRGFAIAGTVLGLAGCIFLAAMGYGLVLGMLGFRDAINTAIEAEATRAKGREAYQVITKQRDSTDALPSDAEGNELIKSYSDNWGTPLRYEVAGETFSLVSAGKDKNFGTDDDLRFSEEQLKQPDFSTTASTTDETEETEEEEMEEDGGTEVDDATTDDATTDDAAGDAETP